MKIVKQFVSNHIVAVVTLIFLSALIIFYEYLSIPHNISFDEIAFAKLALSLDKAPYTVYSPLATGHSTLYFYILLFSLKIFGVTNFALRFPSAVFGVVSILLFYFIMNTVFKNTFFTFFLSCTLLTTRWFINFSRFSFEATLLLCLELFSTFFLFKFLENKKTHFVLLSGITAGLAFHSYYPGRIFFLLPLFVLFLQKTKRYALLFIVVFSLVASPLVIYLAQHSDTRLSQVSIISDKKLTPGEKLTQIMQNTQKMSLMFHLQGDMNGRHNYPGKPALNPILGALFLIGFAVALKNHSKFFNKFFLLYFILSLIPSLFTRSQDNPNMLRTFTVIPSLVYFVGNAYLWIWQSRTRIKRGLIVGVMAVLFTVSAFYEIRTYFVFQSRVLRNSFEVLCNLQEVIKYNIEAIPPKCRVSKNLF